MTTEDRAQPMGRIIAKALSDEAFKKRLLADATATLKAEGLSLPAGVTVKAVENTDTARYLVIPLKPSAAPLDEEHLARMAGGAGSCHLSKTWKIEA